MSSQKDPLEVIVQGGPVDVNAVVYGVVQHALSEAGFTEVTVHSPEGNVDAVVGEIPSLLDVLRVERPAIFDTPITVKQNAHADDVLKMCDDPDNLDIGRIIYGTTDAAVEPSAEPADEAVTEDAPF
ncbi:hypothetical protein AWB81_01785 [Caballeronia arationis]|uniref:hypothetical protein n=1 Tax=Caballeronia arationis TaxID=1777142 RepID=UPI00074BBC6C|nr:hypothetical protein [Caballeronia arationis]SAK59051.1 hypothetical protein AWB81_01785 [Caballeronia arationis]